MHCLLARFGSVSDGPRLRRSTRDSTGGWVRELCADEECEDRALFSDTVYTDSAALKFRKRFGDEETKSGTT
jgi:hypothetical protein